MKVEDYERKVAETDRFKDDDVLPVALGLFGEVGGAFAAAKKFRREGDAFIQYRHEVEEEFGDILWYFAALCRRCGTSMTQILNDVGVGRDDLAQLAVGTYSGGQILFCSNVHANAVLEPSLKDLGHRASALLDIDPGEKAGQETLKRFAEAYLAAMNAAKLDLSTVAHTNVSKVRGRFIQPSPGDLPDFDSGFPVDERIPEYFEVEVTQRANGKAYLKMNGVFIGDPLSDNIADRDGFRFHDVFHFAHAAVLHWSPTFRSLIKHKRKSVPQIEEEQDSGRAIVVEEGLTAWIFAHAKKLAFFEGKNGVSFGLLKTVQQFVEGYEVERCPLKLWENAIIQGYDVFRGVVDDGGGTIVGDRRERKIYLK